MADAGDIIYIARREAGISQSELARRSGVSQASISAYESDKTSPAFETLEWLVAHCGMYLTVRLEAHVAPPLPDHPWAKGVEKLRDRIVHAVHEHDCHAPSIAPPAQALRKPVLLVSADAPL